MNPGMARIAVLGSGTGSNFKALWEAFGDEIVVVISDQDGSGILEKARRAGVAAIYEKSGSDFCERILTHLDGIDLVCLAGFMRLVKKPLLVAFAGRILNIHPSLLPSYPGLHAWQQAVMDGASKSGCTVHVVDAGMDTGEVIMQAEVPVLSDDTPQSLHARIQIEEHRIYPLAVQKYLDEMMGVE
jgi:phosphoribosylglycinamide formyltransferase-1